MVEALMFPKPKKRKKKRPGQKAFRERILKADDEKCMDPMCDCHKDPRENKAAWLEAHHIISRSLGPDNRLLNGITFCRVAHERAELGYRTPAGRVPAAEYMLRVLEQHLDRPYFRWQKVFDKLKKRVERH